MKPDYLFTSSTDGHLYDTRRPAWHLAPPLRANFCRIFRRISNARELCATLRAGPYAWPGGYPIVLITSDGEMASPAALLKDRGALYVAIWDIRAGNHGRIIGAEIYEEGPIVQCAYTGAPISSAYGDPEEESTEDTAQGADNGN